MHTPTSTSSLIGDCIGMESCVDYQKAEETSPKKIQPSKNRIKERGKMGNYDEYPPPIPWLARTGNLPSHMPWVYKRYYTEDGRLVIREEKVKHHEYFRAVRSNGRLILNLVPLDDVDDRVAEDDGEKDDEVEDEEVEDRTVEDEVGSIGVEGNNGNSGGKCVEYKSMRTSTCSIFGMQVPPFTSIRI